MQRRKSSKFLSHTQLSNNSKFDYEYDFYNVEARYNAGIGTIKDLLVFSAVSSRIISIGEILNEWNILEMSI